MPNIPLLLANIGFAIILISLTFRDILWLRVLCVLGTVLVFPLYVFRDEIVWTSLGWNFAGVLINLLQIVILILYRRPLVLKGIEKQIYTSVFNALNPRTFVKIFKLAKLEEHIDNTILIRRNDQVGSLYLIIDGNVEVTLEDNTERIISSNIFIGEQPFITGETASATVRILSDRATLLKWDSRTLQDFLDKDAELSNTFDLILTTDIIGKLRRMAS